MDEQALDEQAVGVWEEGLRKLAADVATDVDDAAAAALEPLQPPVSDTDVGVVILGNTFFPSSVTTLP